MTTLAAICARMGSTRFPGKMLTDINGMPLVWHVARRALAMQTVDRVVLATPHVWDGPEDDVVGRLQHLARIYDADIIVRICGDSPLWDVGEADRLVNLLVTTGQDYVAYHRYTETVFCGVDIMTRWTLENMLPGEHANPALGGNDLFWTARTRPPWHLRGTERLSIDTPEDLERLRGRIEDEAI